jgi:NAD-dependent SIR2 family protein deacetylase
MNHIQNESKLGFLDVFDKPVRKFVEDEIRKIGYNPSDISPIIDVAITEAKRLVHEEDIFLPNQILRYKIGEHTFNYIRGVLAQSKKLKSIHDRLRSYSSVFLVGAGISFESGIPLVAILSDLLRFCEAKDYKELRKDNTKCHKFKSEFKKICNEKEPGYSHKLIVLNFPEYIKEIICLNWDNLIERSALKLRKEISKINENNTVTGKSHLWKFHGDVDNIKKDNKRGKGSWIFPDEKGYVFECFMKYVKESGLTSSLFTFMIVGYSEKEEEIYKRIIQCFQEKPPRPTFRIGLDLSRLREENYAVGPSDYVLKEILPIAS